MSVVEVELPAVYLDALAAVTAPATRIVLVNRFPEPNADHVSASTDIDLMLVDTRGAATGIDLAQTKIYINGFLNYDGSLGSPFVAPWDGGGSAVTSVGANAKRFLLNATVIPVFFSEATVTVRVVSNAVGGGAAFDQTYVFYIADTSPTALISVLATSEKTVKLGFSEPLRLLGDGDATDGLTPANYVLTALSSPAVTPTVTKVRFISSTLLEVTTSEELTGGATYEIDVFNVKDTDDNAVAPRFGVFTALACQAAPAGRDFDLYKMLPGINRREDSTGDLKKFISCIQEVADLLLCMVDDWGNILDPDVADEQYLDAMLYDLGNPFNFPLTVEQKRLLLRILVSIYRQKGTAPGLIDVVRFFMALTITVQLYTSVGMSLGESELGSDGTDGTWELGPDGSFARYSFNVTVTTPLTDAQRTQLRALVNYMKPAHTHFVLLIEPFTPATIDHLELGESELGSSGSDGSWTLH